ncbi:MAG: arylsulfatase [Gammaproteobacteria bacterium]|nr:arylsulfatase [Gammaproteobacteria bacterium]
MKPFQGTVNVDIRESQADWTPYLPPKAPENAPNVLYIVWDDVGIAGFNCFGNPVIETPNMDRIAKLGLRYSNWHTTALCSPTRSCLLTGRSAHHNNMACITEAANGFPGLSALIPPENGMLSEILVEHGWATYALGKWHLSPDIESTVASTRRSWPLGRGFERFYGFIGAETNQFYPDLMQDNQPVEQPYLPNEGYHLSKDLTEKAISYIADVQQCTPNKPWFLYLAYGATHAPHHAPQEWIDKYKGKFDMGYEAFRELTLKKMKQLQIIPENTELPPLNPWPVGEVIIEGDYVRPWNDLNEDEKKLFCRMAEVYAGFLSYTDHQIGLLLNHLEETGQLENTIIVAVSDNGASAEGSPNGSVNENKFFNNWPDDLQENLNNIDKLGSPDTYNHYPTGWAAAFNTPYKMFKRYSLEGGIADACIISWPKAMTDVAGQVRDQYHHATDIVPTVLNLCGIEPPKHIKGVQQSDFDGITMDYSFKNAHVDSARKTQYYAMLGTRAIYHDGWKAVARHAPLSGKGNFHQNTWELYHLTEDRTELCNLADKYPEKLHELINLWFVEAGRNNVLPLDDRSPFEQMSVERPTEANSDQDRFIYYPHTSPVPNNIAVDLRGRDFGIEISLNEVSSTAEGILFAQGSRFGGQALFVQNHRLIYVNNFIGIEEQIFESSIPLPEGNVKIELLFAKKSMDERYVTYGDLKLSINGQIVNQAALRMQPGKYSLTGEGLCIGRDSADPVSVRYNPPFAFKGGVIKSVIFDVSGKPISDLQKDFARMLAKD